MILMIDEERRRMVNIKNYLEETGYHVNLIDNVDDASKFIEMRLKDIDAIILDMMMPWGNLFSSESTELGVLTGFRLYEKIRIQYGYKIPIIIYTALHRPELFNALKKQRNCSIIPKPGPPSKIITELEKYNIYPLT